MNRTVKRIGIVLIVIILLPAAFLTINEFASKNENEKVIEKIYSDQLEAILFSVNQYSEDVVSGWANRVDRFLDELESFDRPDSAAKIESFFREFPSLDVIVIADSVNDEHIEFLNWKGTPSFTYKQVNFLVKQLLLKNQHIINRLLTYKKSGYKKLEPVDTDTLSETSLLLFIEETPAKANRIVGLAIDPRQFIYRILSSKIREIGQQKFVLSVFNPLENFRYSERNNFNTAGDPEQEIQQQRALWIFPDYQIGISIPGETLKDIILQRVTTNIILISLLTLVLIFGVWIVFGNVKKEVELAQIRSDFVSNVSHELRTPLALISMFSETLEMDRVKSDEKRKEYYSIISQEANRLGRIVNTILNFSKMEAGKRKYNFTESYLNDIVENVYRSYKFHLENKGFVFNVVKNENIPIIKIDEEAISEALVNLVDNAVKYSDKQKEITIRTGIESGSIFVEVEDRGIGIPAKDQKKIFEKFFRVGSGNVHNVKGTGLGLTIVKHIIDAHKGKIELKSEVNKGSIFRILFPKNLSGI